MPDDEFLASLGKPQRKSSWVICKGCGLVFQCPRITAADEERLYAGDGYYRIDETFTERYLANRLEKPRRVLGWLQETDAFAGIGSPTMLEVGCGIGGALAVFGEAGWKAAGVEPDKRMAAYGIKRFGVNITPGFFADGMYPPESFDLVYTNHAYEHFRDPAAITAAVAKVLKPGGCLFVAVPTYRRAVGVLAWQWMNAAHTYLYTHVSLGNLVGAFGLETIEWRYPSAGSEVWFLAKKTGRVQAAPTQREDWRAVRREILVHPLRHLVASPRGWPTVARCYLEEFAGPGVAAAAVRGARRLRFWRRPAGTRS
jgi:SAM-dependent methyltransferase